jgi:hypothetical protein
MGRKTKFQEYYILFNLKTFEVHITRMKCQVANILGVGRNKPKTIKDKTIIKDYLVIPITEE